MSRLIRKKAYLFSTLIGTVMVERSLVQASDVEDMVHDNAMTQARNIQFENLGRQIDANARLPQGSIPSAFLNPGGEDEEEII